MEVYQWFHNHSISLHIQNKTEVSTINPKADKSSPESGAYLEPVMHAYTVSLILRLRMKQGHQFTPRYDRYLLEVYEGYNELFKPITNLLCSHQAVNANNLSPIFWSPTMCDPSLLHN